MSKKIKKSDLDKTLRELGFKEGDEINLPSKQNQSNETNTEGEGDEGDGEGEGNGGNHPKKGGGN